MSSSSTTTSTTTVKRNNIPPINLLFRYLQEKLTVSIWLFEQNDSRINGKIVGFDEFMNLVVDDAIELTGDGKEIKLGKLLLKGDNITLISCLDIQL
ncbi:unnamed protein product [Candida verbasci]|uniref:Small nuclear ribonucleoprotein E n=1 Tax=Candida verbasci TaxID=1227364 RepID=A0A9W4XJ17_9ASCO|nr:unnamed protein product [Candida verbasci]